MNKWYTFFIDSWITSTQVVDFMQCSWNYIQMYIHSTKGSVTFALR